MGLEISEFRAAAKAKPLGTVIGLLRQRNGVIRTAEVQTADPISTPPRQRSVCAWRYPGDKAERRRSIPKSSPRSPPNWSDRHSSTMSRRRRTQPLLTPKMLGQKNSEASAPRSLRPNISFRRVRPPCPSAQCATNPWPNAGRSKTADKIGTHGNGQACADIPGGSSITIPSCCYCTRPAGRLSALQVQRADKIADDFAIAVNITGSADELHVAADTGKILSPTPRGCLSSGSCCCPDCYTRASNPAKT